MPGFRRDVIRETGMGDRALEIIQNAPTGRNAAYVVRQLLDDPVFMARLEELGFKTLFPSHVHMFLTNAITEQRSVLAKAVGKEGELAIVAAKDRILKTLQVCDDWESMVRRCMTILQEDLDEFERERDTTMDYNETVPADQRKKLPEFPHDLVNTTRKALVASIEFVKALRQDHQLNSIIRAQTVNIRNGIDQDELLSVLADMAGELGVSRDKMLEAYSRTSLRRKTTAAPVDADFKPGSVQ